MNIGLIKSIHILIVEDNIADVRMVQEMLKKGKICVKLQHVSDGIEAMEYLQKEGKFKNVPTPDLILLDLGLPKKDGREVLEDIKKDENLKNIPIIIMTISKDQEDIYRSYNLRVNAYIVKHVELGQFIYAITSIENFWLSIIKLPPDTDNIGSIK